VRGRGVPISITPEVAFHVPERERVPYQTQVRRRAVSISITPEIAFSVPDRERVT
jgi:hypothetical protein